MISVLSVSKFNSIIKQIFDAEEYLHNIKIEGEVFGVSLSRNVIYFSLKDENATLPCVSFYPKLIDVIKEGAKIIATGSPNYYVKGGRLNFNVTDAENAGQGQLYEEFLRLKQKLQDEGLFDQSHKKPLPQKINRIGVITSKEGAVLQDIKNIAWRRNPSVDIVLYNTKVQGNNAEMEIAQAIDLFGKYDKVDVIVVARGGGSLEDLKAYNTEIVARAAYNCPLPIISAVGHETDFTIIDFVSDLRAPTPSAAAELLTFNLDDKRAELFGLYSKFTRAVDSELGRLENDCKIMGLRFTNQSERLLSQQQNRLENINKKLLSSAENLLSQKYYELGLLENALNRMNPECVLKQGYARIEQNGQSLAKIGDIDIHQNILVTMQDGQIAAKPIDKI